MPICRLFWTFVSLLLVCLDVELIPVAKDQKAPAQVHLKFLISKFNQETSVEQFQFKLCIDKNKELCFWSADMNVVLNDEPFKEVSHNFNINNMNTNLTIGVTIETEEKKIHFSKKMLNLKEIKAKEAFEFHSLTLENLIKMTLEHQCVKGYYPPHQCTKLCYPAEDEYSCDEFGNKICKEGKSCESSNPCSPNPCKNNGKCFIKPTTGSFYCSCSEGFIGSRCDSRKLKPCICPENMKCNYSESGVLYSCTSEASEEIQTKKSFPSEISEPKDNEQNDQKLVGLLDNKKNQSWQKVSITTTIVAAVGCLMILLSIAVSVYVLQRTRNYSSTMKSAKVLANSPSTQYTHFSPNLSGSTFKRSLSIENNSAYLQGTPTILSGTPGILTLGSSNGYSINSNSYQENPDISFINYPTYSALCKQDVRPSYLVMNRSCIDTSNTDTLSSGSIQLSPVLPPRPVRDNDSPLLHTQNPE